MSASTDADAAMFRKVRHEISADARVEPEHVAISVADGVVTLTGTVGSWSARSAAQEAAHRVPSVLDVVNDVAVEPTSTNARRDKEPAQEVRRALEVAVGPQSGRIRTTISRGVVTLEGRLDSWTQLDAASSCLRNLASVRQVRSLVVLGSDHLLPSKGA